MFTLALIGTVLAQHPDPCPYMGKPCANSYNCGWNSPNASGACQHENAVCDKTRGICQVGPPSLLARSFNKTEATPQSDACPAPEIQWFCPTDAARTLSPANAISYPTMLACRMNCTTHECCYPMALHNSSILAEVCGKIAKGPHVGRQCTSDNRLGPGGGDNQGYECRNGGEFRCWISVPECTNDCDLCTSNCTCEKDQNYAKLC
jgi:hypothetical protein